MGLPKSFKAPDMQPFGIDDAFNRKRRSPARRILALTVLVSLALWLYSCRCSTRLPAQESPKDVDFDKYSLIIKGQRVFLHSGEFHTFRLPVPSLWQDIFDKARAAGLNSLSIYLHMGLINPAPGVVDFDDYRALKPIFEAAMRAGIWIVLRPGPYINAETSAGGISHWITSQVAGPLRTNATDWEQSWKDYILAVIDETKPYQVTNGGPVIAIQIDNEYTQHKYGHAEYFQQLEDLYRSSGIDIPLTYNDPSAGGNFINGTGAADLYGLDAYPQRFDCSNPKQWFPVDETYHEYHEKVNPSQPFYVPEFQAGAYDPWGPQAPGYAGCAELTGPEFQSVFNLQLWASNAKLINYYMFYGGTSWGGLPFPGVYTSYDYGAPITESRQLTDKYTELKRQGLFIRSSPEFYKTNWVGDSDTGAVTLSSPDAFGTLLENPDTRTRFYIVRQRDSTSTAKTSFSLDVATSQGHFKLPQVARSITLDGRQSKVIVADYTFGSSKLLYSTAQVLFAGRIGGRDILFLYGDAGQEHEASLTLTGMPNRVQSSTSCLFTPSSHHTIVNFLVGIRGLVTVWDSDTQLVLFSDTTMAGTFWAPPIAPLDESSPYGSFWQFGTNSTVLVGGPYLVRDAKVTGSVLELQGDIKEDVMLSVIAPKHITSISWNGEDIGMFAGLESPSVLSASLSKSSFTEVKLPKLGGWKYADSLPELQSNFSDAEWTLADHTTTNIPFPMHYGDGRVLYGCDYGFCENVVLWRGHFEAREETKSVNLSINGGQAFAASVWLNDVFLGTSFGNSSNNHNIIEETDETFAFPEGAVNVGQNNILTVVQDNMGLEEGEEQESKNPRGIRGFALNAGKFTEWKVQGKVGGYTNYPDKVRGLFNEGGLFGERKGWHLPGYDTSGSHWSSRDLSHGLPGGKAGVGFFVTTFDLNIRNGLDVMLSFTFGDFEQNQPYRALLFINGWMMGKRIANLGPQHKFPVHEGILNYRGKNTVVIALWAMANETVNPRLELTLDGVVDGGVGGVVANNPAWSPEGRL